MIAALALLGALAIGVPGQITVAGPGGDAKVPVRLDPGGAPVIPAPQLLAALGGTVVMQEGWAEVTVARQPFRFLVGAPLYLFSSQLQPWRPRSGWRATPSICRFNSSRRSSRISWASGTATMSGRRGWRTSPMPAMAGAPKPVERLPNGLRPGHVVTIDPGHGGVDPGNPGTYFPRGVREKDVTLQVGLLLREELRERGVGVRMTRTTDTLIALGDRGGFCTAACDLFVSLHVNSLARRRGYTEVRGFETFFLAEARTEDAARVAKMENEAVRFETGESEGPMTGGARFHPEGSPAERAPP